MNDLEELLRTEMRDATDLIEADLDLESVTAAGDRVLAGRVVRRSLGAAAAVVAVGLLAYSAIVNRPIAGIPAPAATIAPSPSPTPTASTDDPQAQSGTKVVDMAREPFGAGLGIKTISITVRGGDAPEVDVVATMQDGQRISRHGAVDRGAPLVAKLNVKVWVVVTRGSVVWAEAAVPGGLSYASTDSINGSGLIIGMADAGKDGTELAGLMWQDTEGHAWNDRGDRVPAARLSIGGRSFWFAHDLALGIACSGETKPGQRDPSQECGVVTSGLAESGGGGSGGDGWEDRAYLVLPSGARDPMLEPNPKCAMANAPLDPSGRIVVLLLCKGSAQDPEGMNASIRYTDAGGKIVTYAP